MKNKQKNKMREAMRRSTYLRIKFPPTTTATTTPAAVLILRNILYIFGCYWCFFFYFAFILPIQFTSPFISQVTKIDK